MTSTAEAAGQGQLPGFAVPYAQVDELDAEWVLDGMIPAAELTIAAGLGGTGKGMWCADLAARISRGAALPGEDGAAPQPAGSVLIVSAEDDPNVVTAGRLRSAGADMTRVYDMSTVDGAPFTLPDHLPQLRAAITAIGDCRLVILDPLAGVAPVPLTSVARVRGILAPLRRIAQDTGSAMLITHHLTKGREVAGSRAVVDGVRSVLMIARDTADEDIRVVSVHKTNMGAGAPPLHYKIADCGDGTARVEYVADAAESPASGQERISAVLATGGTISRQVVAARAGLPYGTTGVLLARMVKAGTAVTPRRGWFAAPAVSHEGVTNKTGREDGVPSAALARGAWHALRGVS